MRGLMRLLIMFGPMIFRQFQKMQRNRSRQQPTQYPDRQVQRGPARGNQRQERGEYVEYKDLNAELGRPTPEEKAMNLKEDEIMLNKEDLRHFDKGATQAADTKSMDEELEELKEKPLRKKALDADDLDLKDLFLDK